MKRLFTRGLLLLALLCGLVAATETMAAKKGPPKDPGIRGKITAMTQSTPTITVDDKVIYVDDSTTVTLDGRPARLQDVKIGAYAQVNTFTLADKLTAVSIRLFSKAPVDAEKPKKKKKE